MRKETVRGTEGGKKKSVSCPHSAKEISGNQEDSLTHFPLQRGAAGEINNKGEEKTGGYPNGEEISLSRQRSPREPCGAGRRRAREHGSERAEAAGGAGGQRKARFIHRSG